ncbi:MAG TPA: hypothetical protein VII84_04125 [Acidimicrobiales bacterium]
MSVITFPRRIDTRRERPVTRPTTRRPTHRAATPRSRAARSVWRRSTVLGKSTVIVVMALALSLAGSMVVANRQVEIHQLQSQLLQDQSTYAEQVGTLTNVSTPSQIASQAGALHLVDPVSVIQVPSTSLDAPLPLPRFSGHAPVTSRTIR